MMSGRGYRARQRHSDNRYRHNHPSNRSQRRRHKPVVNRRQIDHDTYRTKQTRRRVSTDVPMTSRLRDARASVGDAIEGSDTNSRNSLSPNDHDGTPIPDHVWVGEYLDDGDEKDTLPLTYDVAVKEMAYKKDLSEATASVRDLVNPIFRSENMARSSLPALMDFDAKSTRKILSTEKMPPPMPRPGPTQTFSEDDAVLKRYHKLCAALIESMDYQVQLEKQRNQLVKQTQIMSMPAEVYDYGHGEKHATTSRENSGHNKSSEGSRYGFSKQSSQQELGAASSTLDKREQQASHLNRYEDSCRSKYRGEVERSGSHEKAPQKRSVTTELSSNQRVVIPSSPKITFEEFLEIQRPQDPDTTKSSSESLLPLSKSFTFQELVDLQKFLARPSPSIPSVDEGDENYIPVHTSLDKVTSSNREAFPIKVLTSRRRSTVGEDEGDFPRSAIGKCTEGRQPVAQVTPLRIKPILKKASKYTKSKLETSRSPSDGDQMHYPQSSTYGGSFNDTRKVLLDAAKELESRSSKELRDRPLVIVRNASLRDEIAPTTKRGGKGTSSHQATGESLESHFPFNTGPNDSGRKSDTDDEADRRRYERLFAKSRSPTPQGERYVRSRSHSSSRHPSHTSRSSSPGSRYRERGRRGGVSPRKNSRQRDRHARSPPHRLVLPPGKSTEARLNLKGDDKKQKYVSQRHVIKDVMGRRGRSPVAGKISQGSVSHKEGRYSQRQRRHSPVIKDRNHGRNREDSLSSSDCSSSRNHSRDSRARPVPGRHSPHLHQSRSSPEMQQKSDSRTIHSSNRPKLDLFQIAFPTDGGRKLISRKDHHEIMRSDEHERAGYQQQGDTPESDASQTEGVLNFGQTFREVSLDQGHTPVEALHGSSASRETNRNEHHSDSKRLIKRSPSKSGRTENPVILPPKRERRSQSPLWVDKAESLSPHREVYRQRRYQHEEMDSILQDEELPRLLDIEITPLPGLMDVDVSAKPEVKIKDERRFTSRSTTVDSPNSPVDSKVLFEERQKKKIITNPRGKIVLKRKDDGGHKTTKVMERRSQEKADQTKKTRGLETQTKGKGLNVQPKQTLPVKKVQVLRKPNLPDTNQAPSSSLKTEPPKGNLSQVTIGMKKSPSNDWLAGYKTWFQQNMQPVLQNNDQAKELGLQDPIHFLGSVTKGNRRSLSFVPRGMAAKEILKFIALNKKLATGLEASGKVSTEGPPTKNISDFECMRGSSDPVDEASAPTNLVSSKSSEPSNEGENEFFVIDKKPIDPHIHGSTKKSDQDAEDKHGIGAFQRNSQAGGKSKSTKIISENPSKTLKSASKSPISLPMVHSLKEASGDTKSSPILINSSKENSSDTLVYHSALSSLSKQTLQAPPKPERREEPSKLPSTKLESVETTELKEDSDFAGNKLTSGKLETPIKKFRSWQDALLFPEDDKSLKTKIPQVKDMPKIKSKIPQIKDMPKVLSPALTSFHISYPKDSFSECDAKPTDESTEPLITVQPYPRESPSDSKKQSLSPTHPLPATTLNPVAKKKPPPAKKIGRNRPRRRKTVARPHAENPMQSKNGSSQASNDKANEISAPRSAKTVPEWHESQQETALAVKSPNSLKIPVDVSDTDLSPSPSRRRGSFEQRTFSRRNSNDKSTAHNKRNPDRKRRPSFSPSRAKTANFSSDHKKPKADVEFFTDQPVKPELTTEQESLLPDFKRQVEKFALKTLNIFYKIENYKKYKIINAANATLRGFNETASNKAAGFSIDHALYCIWCLFQEPTKDAQDDVKRKMRKIYREEACFDVSLRAFLEFQTTVFNLCRRNLNRNIRYASQKPSELKYVRVQSQYAFPQFDGEAHVMMKLWTWLERMYSISWKDSIRRPNVRLRSFPESDMKPMEERVAQWLKDVLHCKIYDNPVGSSCELLYEVKRQLMKRKAHATNQEAVAMVARAWTRNYFYTIEKVLLPNMLTGETSEAEDTAKDELMVVDEIYSDESDSETEDLDIDVEEDLTGVQIDLF